MEYSTAEHALITENLETHIAPELVQFRPGANGLPFFYIGISQVRRIADTVFGTDGWSITEKSVTEDFCDENNGQFEVHVTLCVRLTIKDGTFREDVGGGTAKSRTKHEAFNQARMFANADATKRAMRQFGDALGLCLYDKEYLKYLEDHVRAKSEMRA